MCTFYLLTRCIGPVRKESIASESWMKTGSMLHLSLPEKCTFNRLYREWGCMKYSKRAEKQWLTCWKTGQEPADTWWMGATSWAVLCTAVHCCYCCCCCDFTGSCLRSLKSATLSWDAGAQCFSAASVQAFQRKYGLGFPGKVYVFFSFWRTVVAPLPREVNNSPAILQPAGHQRTTSVSLHFYDALPAAESLGAVSPKPSCVPHCIMTWGKYIILLQAHWAFAIVQKWLIKKWNYAMHFQLFYGNCMRATTEELKDEDWNTNSPRSMR